MKDEEIYAQVLHEEWWADGVAVTIDTARKRVAQAIAITREDCAKYHEERDAAIVTEAKLVRGWRRAAALIAVAVTHRESAAALRERGK